MQILLNWSIQKKGLKVLFRVNTHAKSDDKKDIKSNPKQKKRKKVSSLLRLFYKQT